MQRFSSWLTSFEKNVLASWGYFDKSQLIKDCSFHSVNYPFDDKYINLKTHFKESRDLKRGVGLAKAMRIEKLHFEGIPHRAIDDAFNISRILESVGIDLGDYE